MRARIKKIVSLFGGLSLPAKLAAIHTLIISASMALYPTGIFIPGMPYDDVYIIYLLAPGIHIFMIAMLLSHQLFPWLLMIMSPRAASVLGVVFIPGLVGIIIGGWQWYFIGKIILLFRRERQTGLR
ncbi:MAG TPA: hypothetical protein VF604_11940 [Pyrinomonadaceae bacterium]|jgi:hypothetical protein